MIITIVKAVLLYLIYGCISTLVYEFWVRPRYVSRQLIEEEPRLRDFVIFWPFLWLGVIIGAINCLIKRK